MILLGLIELKSLFTKRKKKIVIWKFLFGQKFSLDKIFRRDKILVGQHFSSVKILVTSRKFRHFCPTKFCPIRYLNSTFMTLLHRLWSIVLFCFGFCRIQMYLASLPFSGRLGFFRKVLYNGMNRTDYEIIWNVYIL